jgi:hypothetical protein
MISRHRRPRGKSPLTDPAAHAAALQTQMRTGPRFLIQWSGGGFRTALLSEITVGSSLPVSQQESDFS